MLAIASVGESSGSEQDRQQISVLLDKAARFLMEGSSIGGDIGDKTFRTESHALATAALLCCIDRLQGPEQRKKVAEQIALAVNLLRQNQDRSMSSPARGGWKMEANAGSNNDRRASGWALLALVAARQLGIEVRQPDLDRGTHEVPHAYPGRSRRM